MNDMKIGIESGSYNLEADDYRVLRRLKAAGFDAIDFQGFVNTENDFFTEPERDVLSRLQNLSKAVSDAGLTVSQTHGPWRWPPEDSSPEAREERYEKMDRSIRFTSALGCQYLVLHPIMPNGVAPDTDPKSTLEMNLDFFGGLSKAAEREGVIICLENMPMPDFSLASPKKTCELAKMLDSDYVRCCFDTGHATMFGDIGDGVRAMGDFLKVLHIHDNDGLHDQHLLPYQGVGNWQSFSGALKEIGFDGVLSAETNLAGCYPDAVMLKKEVFIAEILKSLK